MWWRTDVVKTSPLSSGIGVGFLETNPSLRRPKTEVVLNEYTFLFAVAALAGAAAAAGCGRGGGRGPGCGHGSDHSRGGGVAACSLKIDNADPSLERKFKLFALSTFAKFRLFLCFFGLVWTYLDLFGLMTALYCVYLGLFRHICGYFSLFRLVLSLR